MVTNKDVNIWINRCRNKALKSVDDEITTEINKWYNEIHKLQVDFKALESIKRILARINIFYTCADEENIVDLSVDFRDKKNWERYYDKEALVIAYIKKYDISKNQKLQELYNKKEAIETEHLNLKDKISVFRNPQKRISYLKELGFDVSTLTESNNVNKKYLFVCGDNKPDVIKKEV